jgi:hypothetical protein
MLTRHLAVLELERFRLWIAIDLLFSDIAPRPHPNSPNFFTHDFSHDWCVTDGEVRISGEDHFSGTIVLSITKKKICSLIVAALKPPRTQDRCARLEKWLRERYPSLPSGVIRKHYGIYSETPGES